MEIAAECVRLKVDVIVTTGGAVLALKQATSIIPIVFALASDPVGGGLVASLARPGSNVTGKVFDPSSFGYRKGRKTSDALTKIWREVEAGNEWIVDADLKDFFGSVDHEKLLFVAPGDRPCWQAD